MKFKIRSRQRRHKLYLEERIHELHQKLFKEVIDEGTVDQLSRKLLLKYHSKLKKIE
jgi:hypothetical protein